MSRTIRFRFDATLWEASIAGGEVAWVEAITPTESGREYRTRAELLYRWSDLMLLRQQALDEAQTQDKEVRHVS